MTDVPARTQLTNVRLATATMMECQEAEDGSPRLGLFYGPSGYGKSVAAATLAARFDAAYVVAHPLMTKISLLQSVAAELGILKPKRTSPEIFEQIVAQLRIDGRPLVIDEMDILEEKKLVPVVRALHDHGEVPVLMIGEETMPAKLKRWEQFDNRILVATPAQKASLEDALVLRDAYCPKVMIADDLVAAILTATKGVTRRVVTNLQAVQATALREGRMEMGLADWHGRPFNTGVVPIRKAA